MQAGKNQASARPTAFGSLLQSSCYGSAIPVIYGRTITAPLAIWAANLRTGNDPSSKKGKNSKKKGPPVYVENIDFLLGKNPLLGVLQLWNNSSKWPLASATYVATSSTSAAITIPDSHFYAVLGVTITASYSETFNDYGAQGPSTVSGSYEIPLWNALFAGPDPTDASAQRNWPFTYRWEPSYGATLYIDGFGTSTLNPVTYPTVTVYYAQLMDATSFKSPLSKLRLSFEAVLGSGDEYDDFSAQQIEYPWYAGMGSQDIDLGSSGAIPQIQAETQGKWGVYPSGDCDFVDIIEDVLKSGITQSAIGGSLGFGPTQHGVGCFDFPGCVQKKAYNALGVSGFTHTITFDMPNTAGNVLVVWAERNTTGPITISDTLGNTWVQAFAAQRADAANWSGAVWYCTNCKAGTNTISIDGGGFSTGIRVALELAGVDSFDAVASGIGLQPKVSLTTTNAPGQTSVILGLSLPIVTTDPAPGSLSLWPLILSLPYGGIGDDGTALVQQRNVKNPGTYELQWQSPALTATSYMVLLAFKATQPPTYPNPLPNILDADTRELARLQCRAGGLWGSLNMNAQKAASDWINDLVTAGNIAPVWSGFRLKLVPRSEVSAVGNGAVYIAPTAGGPVADLDADKGDFICAAGESPITVVRKARTDLNTVLQMQHLNRSSDYNQVVTAEPDAASIAIYGVRKADPVVNNAIQDVAVARPILRIMTRRQNYIEPVSIQFKLNARWQLLESMDLVTVTDRQQGIIKQPVRLQSVEEDDSFNLTCEAEPFIYGIHAPQVLPVTNPDSYRPSTNDSAGNVNTPIIFEPVPRLYASQNLPQLWLVVSSPSANYGGCQVFISTDGGSSYNLLGAVHGNAVTGVSTADWPASADPDTVNDLALDLSESLGVLDSYQVSDEDNFVYPCYVAGGGASTIPYELMTYATATLTAANQFTLKATGTGNHLRRAVYAAPALGAGVDHPAGSRFALLSPDGVGILKVTMDPLWIGKTLYFKFCSVNTFGSGAQALADVAAYSYTPSGGSGSVNPAGLPAQGFQVNGA